MTRDPTNDGEPDVERSLRALEKSFVPAMAEERAAAQRARVVPELAALADREFQRRRRRRNLVRAGVLGAGLAAAAALAMLVTRAEPPASGPEPGATLVSATGDVRIGKDAPGLSGAPSPSTSLGASDRVRTGEGTAEVRLRTGAAVELGPRTDLSLGEAEARTNAADERVSLAAGTIVVRVPKLGRGRFVVETPHAAITVHGTVFRVAVQAAAAGAPLATQVSVTEGKVSVASGGREIFLSPGADWSSAPAEAASESTGDAGRAERSALREERDGRGRRSTLREENELFRAALAARRAGDAGRAIELVDDLLRRYPGSPLEGAARAERARAREQQRGTPAKP